MKKRGLIDKNQKISRILFRRNEVLILLCPVNHYETPEIHVMASGPDPE